MVERVLAWEAGGCKGKLNATVTQPFTLGTLVSYLKLDSMISEDTHSPNSMVKQALILV